MGLRAARMPKAEAINTPNKHDPLPEGSVSQD